MVPSREWLQQPFDPKPMYRDLRNGDIVLGIAMQLFFATMMILQYCGYGFDKGLLFKQAWNIMGWSLRNLPSIFCHHNFNYIVCELCNGSGCITTQKRTKNFQGEYVYADTLIDCDGCIGKGKAKSKPICNYCKSSGLFPSFAINYRNIGDSVVDAGLSFVIIFMIILLYRYDKTSFAWMIGSGFCSIPLLFIIAIAEYNISGHGRWMCTLITFVTLWLCLIVVYTALQDNGLDI